MIVSAISEMYDRLLRIGYFKGTDLYRGDLGAPVTRANAFRTHDTHPLYLHALLDDLVGTEWYDWDMDTIRDLATERFGSTIHANNAEEIYALQALHNSSLAWTDWPAFNAVVLALNNVKPDFANLEVPTLSQLMAGIDMMQVTDPQPFGQELTRYIAECCRFSGVTYLPPPLDFAQHAASQLMYRCTTCGFVADVSDEDQLCDVCSGKLVSDRPFAREVPDYAKARRPANMGHVEFFLKNDPTNVRARFDYLVKHPEVWASLEDDSTENVQSALLITAYVYMLKRRKQLELQLLSAR